MFIDSIIVVYKETGVAGYYMYMFLYFKKGAEYYGPIHENGIWQQRKNWKSYTAQKILDLLSSLGFRD